MMKKYLFILLWLISIVILSCKTTKMTAEEKAKYKQIKKGDTIEIALTENHSTGYKWQWEIIEGEKNVEFLYDTAKSNVPDSAIQAGYVGGSITKTFVFKAVKKGKTTISFKYVRFNKKVAKTDTFYYYITK